jgi:radical SAM superfamily enzyme YgiQ (UPF0313 family)
MQIVLATSPHVRHPAVLQNDFAPSPAAMYSFAPVGLLALSAVLRKDLNIEPVLFDLNQNIVSGAIALNDKFYRNAAERICENNPDVLGFMTECDSYHHVLQIAEQVKQMRPQCRFVLGGPHASAVAKLTMERRSFVDALVLGEGELSFRDLISTYLQGSEEVPAGVMKRTVGGQIQDGGVRALAPELDELPIPAYDMYRGTHEEEIFMEVGRGCPFQCTFCSTAPFWKRRHRVKSPARILEEIRLVQSLFHSRRVHFTHDLLTTDKHWVADLCNALIKAGTPVKWTCSARTDTVDRSLLELMAAAGCNAIYFGIESGSQRLLREIQKDVPIEDSLEILRICRECGITPNAGFIAGFPTENRESLTDTFTAFERVLRLGTKPTHIFGFCPFAQSSLYQQLNSLECHKHFLDIPMDEKLDASNREMIASEPELFGSYFRPVSREFGTLLYGIDEFSCIVEPVLLPALELARAWGGMANVYEKWTEWIETKNILAGASPNRRFYGTPLRFCEFVVEGLRSVYSADHYIVELAEVIRIGLDVAAKWPAVTPTSMATHRSLAVPKLSAGIELGDQLRLNAPVATIRLKHDLTELVTAGPENVREPEKRETYFMWHRSEDNRIQFSQIDEFLHSALQRLQEGPRPVAELMIAWVETDSHALDYDRLMKSLSEAKTMNILETV